MKFINRLSEMQFLNDTVQLSKNKLGTLVISGLRRIGKTRLVLELLKDADLYFFVNKNKNSLGLLKEYENILKKRRVLTELEVLDTWDMFFSVIFERFKGIIVFDEFQNFSSVENSVFGILQKQIDLNEARKELLLIFVGSTIGLIKKLFSDSKEPLYGRLKRKLKLQPVSFIDSINFCSELNIKNIEQVIELYSIFGGYPKYYVTLEDENLLGKTTKQILDRLFFQENAILEEEVEQILSLEFGKRSGTYYDILTAIANGNTRISEIASFLHKKETDLTRQMNELINYFELVGIEYPLFKGRSLFYIRHNLIDFWFRFFYKNISNYKRRDEFMAKTIETELPSFVGKGFENVCKQLIPKFSPFKPERIGRQWGKIPKAKKGKNTYEIDIIALNEQRKEILFGECKWKDKINAEKILTELKEKAKFVKWLNEKRKENFVIFAKSFKKRANCICVDLKDLERLVRVI